MNVAREQSGKRNRYDMEADPTQRCQRVSPGAAASLRLNRHG